MLNDMIQQDMTLYPATVTLPFHSIVLNYTTQDLLKLTHALGVLRRTVVGKVQGIDSQGLVILRFDFELGWGCTCFQAIPIDIDGNVRHWGSMYNENEERVVGPMLAIKANTQTITSRL